MSLLMGIRGHWILAGVYPRENGGRNDDECPLLADG